MLSQYKELLSLLFYRITGNKDADAWTDHIRQHISSSLLFVSHLIILLHLVFDPVMLPMNG